jgi:hypothetical protein
MRKFIKRLLFGLLFLVILVIILAFIFLPSIAEKQRNTFIKDSHFVPSKEAQELHPRLLIADMHSDLLLWKRNPLKRKNYGHTDIPRLIEGNVALQTFAAVTKSPKGQNYDQNDDKSDNITLLAVVHLWPPKTWGSLKERALYQAKKGE